MSEGLSEERIRAIREYFEATGPSRSGNNESGEPLSEFNVCAKPPRRGARNPIERWMLDLPKLVEGQMNWARKRRLQYPFPLTPGDFFGEP